MSTILGVAECNGCGACCDPVSLPFTKLEAMRSKGLDPAVRRWVVEDLTPMSRREARAKAPWIFEQLILSKDPADAVAGTLPLFYRCRWFDEESRACTNYENRPDPCIDYPWQGRAPNPRAALPPTCSYRADVGQPVELVQKPVRSPR